MTCVNIVEMKHFTICSEDFMVTFVKMFVKTCWVIHSDSEYCGVWKIPFCERIKMQPFLFIGHFKRAKLMQYIDCTAPSIHCLLFPSRSTAQRRFCLLFFMAILICRILQIQSFSLIFYPLFWSAIFLSHIRIMCDLRRNASLLLMYIPQHASYIHHIHSDGRWH